MKKKEILKEESELYRFARRSIYAIEDIKRGEELTIHNIVVLRRGNKEKGLEPEELETIL